MRLVFMLDQPSGKQKVARLPSAKSKPSSACSTSSSKKAARNGSKKSTRSSSLRPQSGSSTLNKSVTWGDMDSYGYAAVMDTFPDSLSSGKNTKKQRKPSLVGTLGSGNYKTSVEYTSLQYIQDVKAALSRRSQLYQEFMNILSEVKNPQSDKVEIVKRVINLFDGHPHLIQGFNFFLPSNIVVEVQSSAVVVKVDEDLGPRMTMDSDDDDDDTPTTRYIRNVKWTYTHHPEVYPKFAKILEDFNGKMVNEMNTIHRITALFYDHPDLVLGFNFFLPSGYKILADKRHSYVIEHPRPGSDKPQFSPISPDKIDE